MQWVSQSVGDSRNVALYRSLLRARVDDSQKENSASSNKRRHPGVKTDTVRTTQPPKKKSKGCDQSGGWQLAPATWSACPIGTMSGGVVLDMQLPRRLDELDSGRWTVLAPLKTHDSGGSGSGDEAAGDNEAAGDEGGGGGGSSCGDGGGSGGGDGSRGDEGGGSGGGGSSCGDDGGGSGGVGEGEGGGGGGGGGGDESGDDDREDPSVERGQCATGVIDLVSDSSEDVAIGLL